KVEGYDVTNTQLTEVNGEKIWNDKDNADQVRPAEITIKLLQNGAEYDQKTVSAADQWKYSFTDLPKYDANGAEYEYTVKEEPVAGYSSKVEGYDVTNTQLTEVNGEKLWNDKDNADKVRPTEITVKLYQKVKDAEGEATEYDSLTVTADNGWKYSFTDLPKYDADGAEYEYTVKEEPVAGYSSKVEGYDVTNTQLTEVNGEKVWNDNDDAAGKRPESITVKLLQNGDEIDQKTVSAANQWKYSFTDLPKYDTDGVEYAYTVEEKPVDGYESQVKGYTIINTLIDEKSVKTGDDSNLEVPLGMAMISLLSMGLVLATRKKYK
ncbi:Cna B-type domain-containing protein, partial [Gallibacter intestinalis]